MNQATYKHHRLQGVDELTQREHIYQQYIRSFLQCGRVLDENTIVIYTADQGHFLGEHGFFSKRFMYEEAMRMPLIVRYPGHIDPGSVNTDLVANIDYAPTIIDLAGLSVPEEMQGESITPLLHGNTPDDWRDAIYYRYWQHLLHRDVTAHYGIRTRSHKLIWFHGQSCGITDYPPVPPGWELYDLVEDPGEMNNIYLNPENAELATELKNQLLELKDQFEDGDEAYPELTTVFSTSFW